MPSTSHQFCTPWLQLTPSTWHAGCRILQRPFRWLAEEQSRLWNRLFRASAIGPDHLLAVGTKDQAVGHFGRPQPRSAQLLLFSVAIRPKIPTMLRVSLRGIKAQGVVESSSQTYLLRVQCHTLQATPQSTLSAVCPSVHSLSDCLSVLCLSV